MSTINACLVGVELYFDDLVAAKNFYEGTLGLDIFSEQPGHHAQFNVGRAFLCLEKKGVEDYPSQDKAVVFLEVPSVQDAVEAIGRERFVHIESGSESTKGVGLFCTTRKHTMLFCSKLDRSPKGDCISLHWRYFLKMQHGLRNRFQNPSPLS